MAAHLGLREFATGFKIDGQTVEYELLRMGRNGNLETKAQFQADKKAEELQRGGDLGATVEEEVEEDVDEPCKHGHHHHHHPAAPALAPSPSLHRPAPLDLGGTAHALELAKAQSASAASPSSPIRYTMRFTPRAEKKENAPPPSSVKTPVHPPADSCAQLPAKLLAPTPQSYNESLPRIPVQDFLHHPDVRARAVYWMNRAFISDPTTKVLARDVYTAYCISFTHNMEKRVPTLTEPDLTDLVLKMFKGTSTETQVMTAAGHEAPVIRCLAWKGEPRGEDLAMNWKRLLEASVRSAQDFVLEDQPFQHNIPTEEALRKARPDALNSRAGAVADRLLARGAVLDEAQPAVLDYAFSYFDRVKAHFFDRPEVYLRFLEILRGFSNSIPGAMDSRSVVRAVSALFVDHPRLIEGFKSWFGAEDDVPSPVAEAAASVWGHLGAAGEGVDDFDEHVPMVHHYAGEVIAKGRRLWYIPEPARARLWVRMLFEPGPNQEIECASITAFYTATYHHHSSPPTKPSLTDEHLMQTIGRLYPHAEEVEVAPLKTVIYGLRPRDIPLNPTKLLQHYHKRQTQRQFARTRRQLEKLEASGEVVLRIDAPLNAFQAHLLDDALLSLPAGVPSPWLQRLRKRKQGKGAGWGDVQSGFPGVSMRLLSREMVQGWWGDEEYELLLADHKVRNVKGEEGVYRRPAPARFRCSGAAAPTASGATTTATATPTAMTAAVEHDNDVEGNDSSITVAPGTSSNGLGDGEKYAGNAGEDWGMAEGRADTPTWTETPMWTERPMWTQTPTWTDTPTDTPTWTAAAVNDGKEGEAGASNEVE
ncbi:hypothetical protein B0A55_07770 [Friedmanniomyces simplex]|uniref:RFX-type winged-helix domain-containing protein n=1 Tax=Friedmanniomyces simplex TaxID=329884 RepID=A0A4U0XDA0_9PEZI|nr:hypothetical protein B0A55_07770 [Friedmanniomyces simplex]